MFSTMLKYDYEKKNSKNIFLIFFVNEKNLYNNLYKCKSTALKKKQNKKMRDKRCFNIFYNNTLKHFMKKISIRDKCFVGLS